MQGEDDKNGLLTRWSRRKLQAKHDSADSEPVNEAADDSATGNTGAGSEEDLPDPQLEENRIAAEAVDIESLNYDSDYSVFFKDGVPDRLKRQALKALWRSSPVLANVDGLCDYDEDFGNPDLIMKTFDSAWKVGKGYLSRSEEATDGIDLGESQEDLQAEGSEVLEEENTTVGEPEELVNENIGSPEVEIAEDDPEDSSEVKVQKVSLRRRLGIESG